MIMMYKLSTNDSLEAKVGGLLFSEYRSFSQGISNPQISAFPDVELQAMGVKVWCKNLPRCLVTK